jgi:hypothetical protein
MTFFTILFFFLNDEPVGSVVTKSKEECSELMGNYIQSKYDLFCEETEILSWTMRPKPRPDTLHQEQQ